MTHIFGKCFCYPCRPKLNTKISANPTDFKRPKYHLTLDFGNSLVCGCFKSKSSYACIYTDWFLQSIYKSSFLCPLLLCVCMYVFWFLYNQLSNCTSFGKRIFAFCLWNPDVLRNLLYMSASSMNPLSLAKASWKKEPNTQTGIDWSSEIPHCMHVIGSHTLACRLWWNGLGSEWVTLHCCCCLALVGKNVLLVKLFPLERSKLCYVLLERLWVTN